MEETSMEEVMQNCVFCKIVKGEVPCHKVYEDDKMMAILDIYPSTKGHVLVLPKEHIPILPLMKPDLSSHIFKNLKYIVKGVKKGVPAVGASVFIANGGLAGQNSPHFLFHVIPRDQGDGLLEIPQKDIDNKEVADAIMAKIAPKKPNPVPQPDYSPRTEEPKQLSPTDEQKKKLADTIKANEELRKAVIERPEEIKEAVKNNPKFAELFAGIDIDALSVKLKEADKKTPTEEKKPDLDKVSEMFK